MKINIKELLEYFDLKDSTDFGDTTAVISVVGEDLGAALFKHYCEGGRSSKIDIIDGNIEIPTTMQKIGRRLDRWILEKNKKGKIMYQTEIKNWCSRAIGGVNVPLDVNKETLDEVSNKNWLRSVENLNADEGNGLNKVLVKMISDKRLSLKNDYKKEPLLIFWDARKPAKEKSFFFRYQLPHTHFDFDHCWVFSCSLYLRHLYSTGTSKISIEIPNAKRRINQLNNLFNIKVE